MLQESESNVTELPVRKSHKIDTPFFSLEFKEAQVGDYLVKGYTDLEPLNMMSSVAGALVMGLAKLVHEIQNEVFGIEAIADDEAKPIFEVLDESTCTLNPEYNFNFNEKKVEKIEKLFAKAITIKNSLVELAKQRETIFPNAQALQYTFIPGEGAITDLRQAIKARVGRVKERVAGIELVRRQRAGAPVVNARPNMSAEELLNVG